MSRTCPAELAKKLSGASDLAMRSEPCGWARGGRGEVRVLMSCFKGNRNPFRGFRDDGVSQYLFEAKFFGL